MHQAHDQDYDELWTETLGLLLPQMDTPVRSALLNSQLVSIKDSKVLVGTRGAFSCDFLNKRAVRSTVSKILSDRLNREISVEFSGLDNDKAEDSEMELLSNEVVYHKSSESYQHDPGLNPRYTFSSFVKGNSNNLAAAAAMAVAESPARAYNPLFIYGGVGLGKTHLMHAIGHEILRQNPKAKVVYMSAERFTNEMIDSIGEAKMARFRKNYRSLDVLLVDDIQFLANKERTQEEFFHTFNELHGASKQVVISSDRPPRQIPTLQDRLRSRFEWGMIADVQLPDLETRIAILKKKAEQCKVLVPSEVLTLIAERISSNIRELEGALTRVIACASLYRKKITLELAQENLTGILPDQKLQPVNIKQIQEIVCEYFSLPFKDLVGSRRDQKIVRPRQVAMYLCKELTGASFPEIGSEFGGKDHTTVMHSCRKVEGNLEDHYYKTSLDNIRNRLRMAR